MDDYSSDASAYIREISSCLAIYHDEEKSLYQNLTSALFELYYFVKEYDNRIRKLLEEDNSILNHYKDEINDNKNKVEYVVEFMDIPLESIVKSFLVFTKSSLDKLVLLYNWRYKGMKKSFESRGKYLIKEIQSKRYKGKNQQLLIELIKKNKEDWINNVLNLRDEFTHTSKLDEYRSFTYESKTDKNAVSSLADFKRPTLYFNSIEMDAYEYMNDVFNNLLAFIKDFLVFTGFDMPVKNEPEFDCGNCGLKLAELKKVNEIILVTPLVPFKIKIINKYHKFGSIICPKCTANFNCDLTILEKNGLVKF